MIDEISDVSKEGCSAQRYTNEDPPQVITEQKYLQLWKGKRREKEKLYNGDKQWRKEEESKQVTRGL